MHQTFNASLLYLIQVKLQKLDVRVYLECILVPTAEMSLCVHLCMYQQKVVKICSNCKYLGAINSRFYFSGIQQSAVSGFIYSLASVFSGRSMNDLLIGVDKA